MNILEIILLSSLVSIGITIASGEGMLLNSVKMFIEKNFPLYLSMPLISCIYCMGSVWSIYVYVILCFLGNVTNFNPFMLLVIVPCTTAINFIVSELFTNIKHQ